MRGRDRDSQKEIQSLAGTNIHSIGHLMKHLRLSRKPLLRCNQGTNIHLQTSLWDFHSGHWPHDEVPKVRDPELKLAGRTDPQKPQVEAGTCWGLGAGSSLGQKGSESRLDARSCADSGSADVYEAPALYPAGQILRIRVSKVRSVLEKLFIEGRVACDLTISTSVGCVHRGRAGILSRDGRQETSRIPGLSGG